MAPELWKKNIPPEPERSEPISVQDKIILAKQNDILLKEKVGAQIDYFFHELSKQSQSGIYLLSKVTGIFLLLPLVILYPILGILIKLTSRETVITTEKVTGFRGQIFERYMFRIYVQDSQSSEKNLTGIGWLLKKTKLYNLPSCINLLKGELNLVGPKALSDDINTYWNNQLDEYYKRFAIPPGLIGVADCEENYSSDIEQAKKCLKQEFRYLQNPSFRKSLKILLGIF